MENCTLTKYIFESNFAIQRLKLYVHNEDNFKIMVRSTLKSTTLVKRNVSNDPFIEPQNIILQFLQVKEDLIRSIVKVMGNSDKVFFMLIEKIPQISGGAKNNKGIFVGL